MVHCRSVVCTLTSVRLQVKDVQGYIWGLPVLVPTCPKKLFALDPREKYVDIVTDTLHASSSDLLTWNTLVMMKLGWINSIPREWVVITTKSLEEWKERDEKSPFLPDNRRGYAGVTPVALSRSGIPGLALHTLDQYPRNGLESTNALSLVASSRDMCGLSGPPRLFSQCTLMKH